MQAIPNQKHATAKIWLTSASRLQRYSSSKVWTTTDDGVCHPISAPGAFGLGELKSEVRVLVRWDLKQDKNRISNLWKWFCDLTDFLLNGVKIRRQDDLIRQFIPQYDGHRKERDLIKNVAVWICLYENEFVWRMGFATSLSRKKRSGVGLRL